MKLIVGLGNPGSRYSGTRHNIGFEAADRLAGRVGGEFRRAWFKRALTAPGELAGERVVLAKPLTFMNGSGSAVAGLLRKYGLTVGDLLVVYDDVALPPGRIRVRPGGGDGGHNGVKSVIAETGRSEFARIRIGVGMPPGGKPMIGHVLGRFGRDERQAMDAAVERAADAVELIVSEGLEEAMNRCNGL